MAVDVVLKDRNGNELNVGSKLYAYSINIDVDGDDISWSVYFSTPSTKLINIDDVEGVEQILPLMCEDYQYSGYLINNNDGEIYIIYDIHRNMNNEVIIKAYKLSDTSVQISEWINNYDIVLADITRSEM